MLAKSIEVPPELVLAHRGLWDRDVVPNSSRALQLAMGAGFGLETDVRDYHGGVLVSHDPPEGNEPPLDEIFAGMTQRLGLVALNIKTDGLGPAIKRVMEPLAGAEYFVFDMSVPQAQVLQALGMPIAARVSEFEPVAGLRRGPYAGARYLWIDCFESEWFQESEELAHVLPNVTAVLVSPEIHGRDPYLAWEWILEANTAGNRVGLCTDRPLEFMAWQRSVGQT